MTARSYSWKIFDHFTHVTNATNMTNILIIFSLVRFVMCLIGNLMIWKCSPCANKFRSKISLWEIEVKDRGKVYVEGWSWSATWTTLMTRISDTGRVATVRRRAPRVIKWVQMSDPSLQGSWLSSWSTSAPSWATASTWPTPSSLWSTSSSWPTSPSRV